MPLWHRGSIILHWRIVYLSWKSSSDEDQKAEVKKSHASLARWLTAKQHVLDLLLSWFHLFFRRGRSSSLDVAGVVASSSDVVNPEWHLRCRSRTAAWAAAAEFRVARRAGFFLASSSDRSSSSSTTTVKGVRRYQSASRTSSSYSRWIASQSQQFIISRIVEKQICPAAEWQIDWHMT